MAKIFISYRRGDSAIAAGRIYDRLEAHFGQAEVFMDVDAIPLGVDFRDFLGSHIKRCRLMLVIIGREWLGMRDDRGRRRLDAGQDFVRTEIELALQLGIPVIPVLLKGVSMPEEGQLPRSIAPLAYRNAVEVDAGTSFRVHIAALIQQLEKQLAASAGPVTASGDAGTDPLETRPLFGPRFRRHEVSALSREAEDQDFPSTRVPFAPRRDTWSPASGGQPPREDRMALAKQPATRTDPRPSWPARGAVSRGDRAGSLPGSRRRPGAQVGADPEGSRRGTEPRGLNQRARKEMARLWDELLKPVTPPRRRLAIGDRLAELGDPRRGVGLDRQGLPEIDWVEVPGGPFRWGPDRTSRHLDPFWIARWPVTNCQYQAFVRDGGYREGQWWQGLAARVERPGKPDFGQLNRPRCRINWYEAVAFSRWLSARLGMEMRLPTELEWEKAAGGPEGREYPWGDRYLTGAANLKEGVRGQPPEFLGEIVAVGLYPRGASPYRVLDMAGNLWEWCLNEHESPGSLDTRGASPRGLRGGSWNLPRDSARVFFRRWALPDVRSPDVGGIRLVRTGPGERG